LHFLDWPNGLLAAQNAGMELGQIPFTITEAATDLYIQLSAINKRRELSSIEADLRATLAEFIEQAAGR
jgi:hypothetical protein